MKTKTSILSLALALALAGCSTVPLAITPCPTFVRVDGVLKVAGRLDFALLQVGDTVLYRTSGAAGAITDQGIAVAGQSPGLGVARIVSNAHGALRLAVSGEVYLSESTYVGKVL